GGGEVGRVVGGGGGGGGGERRSGRGASVGPCRSAARRASVTTAAPPTTSAAPAPAAPPPSIGAWLAQTLRLAGWVLFQARRRVLGKVAGAILLAGLLLLSRAGGRPSAA